MLGLPFIHHFDMIQARIYHFFLLFSHEPLYQQHKRLNRLFTLTFFCSFTFYEN